jgi:hypothetical protein
VRQTFPGVSVAEVAAEVAVITGMDSHTVSATQRNKDIRFFAS